MKCPKCQTDNPDTQKYCGECATPLPSFEDRQASPTKTLDIPKEELTTGSTFAGRYQIIEKLGSRLKNLVAEQTFPGWQKQPSVRVSIKRDITLELTKYSKEHTKVELNPDDYSEFSKEAMKCLEEYF